jgi:hypothetical protein
MFSFGDQVKAARLSFSDISWLSNGVLTVQKLKNHSAGIRPLSAADYALALDIIDAHRAASKGIRLLVLSKVKARK